MLYNSVEISRKCEKANGAIMKIKPYEVIFKMDLPVVPNQRKVLLLR
jgi:hypothetical protein